MSVLRSILRTLFCLYLISFTILPCAAEQAGISDVIDRSADNAAVYWRPPNELPRGAPNVLIWMIDDVGFGQVASFGGLTRTPNLDGLADEGLRFTNFHATSLCSPTRAATLAGRNHHAIGMGAHANTPAALLGYNARIPRSAASVARILKDRGYATYALGKWDHLPAEHVSPVGPYDYWPSGQGFEHFYGFLSYDTHHFTPLLWRDHTPVRPDQDQTGYHLTTDIANQAIDWIRQQGSLKPEQPFFMYWSTGAVHGPHHAPKASIEKYRGSFDMGWNAARELILARQKRLGLFPKDAELPPWPENVPAWDSLTVEQQRLAARAMEVFAAMLDHADHEFGRIIASLRETGALENTVIIALSDNGASAEGGLAGSFNELLMGQVDWEENLQHIDDWGGPDTFPHYPVGWAAAGNTPFKYYKQSAHEGGTRVPMLISWPKGIRDVGGIRKQFHHVNDIVPTLLDIIDIEAPKEVDGIRQQAMDGVSFRYAMNDETAPTRKKVQYFELWGNHGIWADGWKAAVLLRPKPWDVFTPVSFDDPDWELYHLDDDFNERINVANEYPEKLEQLKRLFDQEAKRNNVYPMGPDYMKEIFARMNNMLQERNGHFEYYPGASRIPGVLAPPINLFSFEGRAQLKITGQAEGGVIFAYGGAEGGFSLYLRNRKPVFAYNNQGRSVSYISAKQALSKGVSHVEFKLNKADKTSGAVTLLVNGHTVAKGSLENLGTRLPTHETFDVGVDWGSTVTSEYRNNGIMPDGVIEKLEIDILNY